MNPQRKRKKKKEVKEKEEESEADKYEIAHYFFSFLKHEPLNITLVGYFAKVLNNLILRRQSDVKKIRRCLWLKNISTLAIRISLPISRVYLQLDKERRPQKFGRVYIQNSGF